MTLVTLVSRICMKATTMTVRVMAHFRAEEIGSASDAESVIDSLALQPHLLRRRLHAASWPALERGDGAGEYAADSRRWRRRAGRRCIRAETLIAVSDADRVGA